MTTPEFLLLGVAGLVPVFKIALTVWYFWEPETPSETFGELSMLSSGHAPRRGSPARPTR